MKRQDDGLFTLRRDKDGQPRVFFRDEDISNEVLNVSHSIKPGDVSTLTLTVLAGPFALPTESQYPTRSASPEPQQMGPCNAPEAHAKGSMFPNVDGECLNASHWIERDRPDEWGSTASAVQGVRQQAPGNWTAWCHKHEWYPRPFETKQGATASLIVHNNLYEPRQVGPCNAPEAHALNSMFPNDAGECLIARHWIERD